MMQFFVYFTMGENEPMNPPSPEGMAEMGKFMAESFQSGTIVATGQLPGTATRVRLESGQVSLSEGPFIDSPEMIPGFTIIQVESRDQAIDWTSKLRSCMGDGELRLARLAATGIEDIQGP